MTTPRVVCSAILSWCVMAIGMAGMLGYVTGISVLTSWNGRALMAFPTALSIVLISFNLMIQRRRTNDIVIEIRRIQAMEGRA